MGESPRAPASPPGERQKFRPTLGIKQELALAVFPTLMILAVLALLEMFTRQ